MAAKSEDVLFYIFISCIGFFSIWYFVYIMFYSKHSLEVYMNLQDKKEQLQVQINILRYKNAKLQKYYLYSQSAQNKQ